MSVTESKIVGKSATGSGPQRSVGEPGCTGAAQESASGKQPEAQRLQRTVFLSRRDFTPQGRLAASGDICGCLTGRGVAGF